MRLKFCGGCKPGYDRPALAETLKKRLEGKVWFTHDSGETVGAAVVIAGCRTTCADTTGFKEIPVYFITDPSELDPVCEALLKKVPRRRGRQIRESRKGA